LSAFDVTPNEKGEDNGEKYKDPMACVDFGDHALTYSCATNPRPQTTLNCD
jgi:hypothetical protein